MFNSIFAKKKICSNQKNEIINIPVNLIKPNSYQARKEFDKSSLENLCDSINQIGLIQPIIVREMPGGYYELISGERRYRACRIVGMTQILSIVIEINDEDLAILNLVENVQRADLHFFEEAKGYNNLIYKQKISKDKLHKRLGLDQSYILNKIKLLELSPIVRKIIINKNLSEDHARELLKIDNEDLQFKIIKIIYENKLNVKETEELVFNTINNIVKVETNDIQIKEKKDLIGFCTDIRIFINTINQSVKMMKKSGSDIKLVQKNNKNSTEFKIVIKN